MKNEAVSGEICGDNSGWKLLGADQASIPKFLQTESALRILRNQNHVVEGPDVWRAGHSRGIEFVMLNAFRGVEFLQRAQQFFRALAGTVKN
jgi:hypothetical protein